MEWLVNVLLSKIKKYNPEMSEAQLKTRKFGLECLLSDLSKFIFYLIIFSMFNLMLYYLISALVYSSIRSVTGGYHANSYLACFFVSFAVFVAAILAGRFVELSFIMQIILLCASLLLDIIFAPVEHPNKSARSEARRRKFKKISIVLICFLGAVSLILPYNYAICAEASIFLAAVMQPMGLLLNPVHKGL
jgi:accessory gene regulator B